MCNFSKGVWEKGMEAGMEASRKEGAAQTMLNSIKNLMETCLLYTSDAADD